MFRHAKINCGGSNHPALTLGLVALVSCLLMKKEMNGSNASSSGFLNQWATEEFLTRHGLVFLQLSTFRKMTFENRGSCCHENNLEAGLMQKMT